MRFHITQREYYEKIHIELKIYVARDCNNFIHRGTNLYFQSIR